MKTLKKLLGVVLAAAMIFALAACGGGGNTPAPAGSGSGSAAPASGKPVKVMLYTNVMSLDTNLATDGDSFEVIADCIDGLTQMDESGAAVPAIASSWDVENEGTLYTFHLREDANWANGTPVTANDFVFAWQRGVVGNEEYGYMFSDIAQIKNAQAIMDGEADPTTLGVSAKDDKTLVVELEVPVSYFESLMYFPTFYPINQEFYEGLEEGTYGTSPDTYLSNGAFVLSDYLPGTASLSLKKNEDYYDAASVSLPGIEYQVVGSSDNALSAYKNGSLDIVMVNGDQVSAAEADDSVKDNIKVTGAGYMWYLSFSQTDKNANGYLANQNLRLAITNALDREALVDNYVKDGSLATYTCVPPQFAASSTTGEDFSADQTRFADVCSFDTAKAQEYLEKAKSELGVDTFKFTIIYGNNEGDEVAKVAQAIQQQIQDALPGVTIELSNMTKSERLDKMQNDNYEIALTRWGPDYADPMTYLGMWITNNANNYGFWSNAEYDQIITDCTTGQYVTDYDARWNALYDAETLVMNEAVIAPLYTKANANIIASNVTGVEFHPVALNRVYKRCVVQ